MAEIVPSDRDKRKLRACMLCSLVKSQTQFIRDGCDNCDEVLSMKNDTDRVLDCTSGNFEGVIAVIRPESSWVSKWQRVDKFTRGVYAVQVTGKLPIDIQEQLLDKGIKYRPRDGTAKD
ncbi:Spt4/RpoE2 zinc finger-domain-containing protein [Globomyces pollinis-pini]|nr:Spt4/RpoE2 zinc finger-domain-containing protein [Globomyces pollinis-pini]KAJ2996102.1 transcription elongation factor spt4 [Globomyces sp. JEL0801]